MTSVGRLNLIHSSEARELSPRALCGHFRSILLSDARRKITASHDASILNLIISFSRSLNVTSQIRPLIVSSEGCGFTLYVQNTLNSQKGGKASPTRICSHPEHDIWLKVPGGRSNGKMMPQCSRKQSKACSALLPPALLQSMKGKHLYN